MKQKIVDALSLSLDSNIRLTEAARKAISDLRTDQVAQCESDARPRGERVHELDVLLASGQINAKEDLQKLGFSTSDTLDYCQWKLAEIERLELDLEQIHARTEALKVENTALQDAYEASVAKAERAIAAYLIEEEAERSGEVVFVIDDQDEKIDTSEQFSRAVLQEAWERTVARSYGVQ